jgi:hypothetical protein
MALHRDIYWIGRQWAVTGFGLQAVDQRLQGAFDVEAAGVWDEGLSARMRRHAWINGEDFDKALTLARQRFPEPARKSLPLVESVLELIPQPSPTPSQQSASPLSADAVDLQSAEATAKMPQPAPTLQLHVQGRLARFVPQWRVRP